MGGKRKRRIRALLFKLLAMKKITCHDLHGKLYTEEASKFIYRPSVYGVLIEDNKLLLSKQYDGYDLPGGGMNIDETIEDGLKREFFEETGLTVELLQPVHVETSFFKPSHSKIHGDEFWNCPMIYFLVKKISGELSTANFDIEEQEYADMAEWIELEKINSINFISSANIQEVVKKAIFLAN